MGGCWQLVFACCLLVQRLSAEDPVKDNSTSAVNADEELEESIAQRIASLQKMGQDEISTFIDLALQYHNQQKEFLLIPLENTTVTVKVRSILKPLRYSPSADCFSEDFKHWAI